MLKFNTFNKTAINLALKTCLLTGISFPVFSQDYIEPAMVNIPAGTTTMGSLLKDEQVNPVISITLPDFQLGKYPVTVAEYRLFVNDTGYVPTQSCNDHISSSWFGGPDTEGSASWDEHRFLKSEYQPVTCVDYKDMLAYADWISKKTGVTYRLPNEQEWAYAEKGNRNSRYFWGDDPNKENACLYGNFADKSGEYHASKDYGASNAGFIDIVNCDDGEPYNSIVGLYRPNPFGLYDMVGNVGQFLSSCFYEGFSAKTEEEMDINQCEFIVHRAESWHFNAEAHVSRDRVKRVDDNSWALSGFRLATDGHSNKQAKSTKQFELALKKAQQKRLTERVKLLPEPENVFLNKLSNGQHQLTWQPSQDKRVTHYAIYQSKTINSHQRGGYFRNFYDKITTVDSTQNSVAVVLPKQGASYRVVSVAKDITSLPSNAVVNIQHQAIKIPGKVSVKDNIELKNVMLRHRQADEERPELYYLHKFNPRYTPLSANITFSVDVESSGWYSINYYGNSLLKGELFKMWLGNDYLGSLNYDSEIDDKVSNRHKVYLPKGKHQLQLNTVKETFDVWNLAWLEFSKINS